VFGDVRIRVDPNLKLAMPVDSNGANAANLMTGAPGYIAGLQSED
jgi:acetate kinase